MLLVFTLSMTPLMFIYLYGAMEKIDGALLEASELMGFVGIRKVVRIVLPPLILPTVLAGVLVVFMRVFSDYATPMLIGEGYRTVPVLIVNEFIGELGGDSGFAAAISVSVILFATTIFLLQKYVSSRKSFVMSALNPVRPKQETGGIKNVLAHLYVYLFTLLTLFPPIFTLYIRRFARHRGNVLLPGYSLDNFRSAFSRAAVPIRNTFTLGGYRYCGGRFPGGALGLYNGAQTQCGYQYFGCNNHVSVPCARFYRGYCPIIAIQCAAFIAQRNCGDHGYFVRNSAAALYG